jgi:uncharacterized protein YecE (DUF72 family)
MSQPPILAGASGYSYKEWKGPFYPPDLPGADMLAYYAERLPAVEINNTFYRMPKRAVLEGWAARTPAGFRFVLKASRRITHMARLRDCADAVSYLFTTAGALGDKLGAVFFQLPPYLKKDIGLLRDFLAILPEGPQVAVEFRSSSWFDEEVYAALRARDVAFCVTERDEEGKTTPFVATASWGYLRLRREAYPDADLLTWAARLRGQPWTEAYVFFKHEDEAAAPRTAARLLQLLSEAGPHPIA